jgi:hypothetical protein
MKEGGVIWYEERFLIGGRLQHAAMNKMAYENMKSKHSLKSIKNNATMVKDANEDPNETTRRKSILFDDLRAMAKPPGDIFGAAL